MRNFIAEQGIEDVGHIERNVWPLNVARNFTDNSSRLEDPTRQARKLDRAAEDIRAASDSRIANPGPRWVPLQFRVRYREQIVERPFQLEVDVTDLQVSQPVANPTAPAPAPAPGSATGAASPSVE